MKTGKININHLLIVASILVFVVLVTGAVVRRGDPSSGCPDWPTCFGSYYPPAKTSASFDYLHRLSTLALFSLVIVITAVASKVVKNGSRLRNLMLVVLGLLALEIGFGAWLSVGGVSHGLAWVSVWHWGVSLIIFAVLLFASASESVKSNAQHLPAVHHRNLIDSQTSKFFQLSVFALVSVSILIATGSILAYRGLPTGCNSWPLCDPHLIPTDAGGWIILGHRVAAALTGILMVILVYQAWRDHREKTAVLVSTTSSVVLYLAQALLGGKLISNYSSHLLVIHQATSIAIFGVLVVLVALVAAQRQQESDPALVPNPQLRRRRLVADLLLLTKPIVVGLLLVTTFAGMVIGAREIPDLPLIFWTLVGGFMAAGGSGAINQYIDREDDNKMQRTQKRPIPGGRLTPGEGLAFGVALTLASFYVMVGFVNLTAALLTLAGIIYYVLIYSILLKKTTVQNIVIGGGAGAIPPLVGWASATGGLAIPALFLFGVIFMWTPPHFWALALVRRNDYARAGVPMLPVVRGERETRWQIFIYTIELVCLTLFLPVIGLGGAIYFAGAAGLGLGLVSLAWRVWKFGGNKLAWRMYRYSSLYLAMIFLVLMIDRLI